MLTFTDAVQEVIKATNTFKGGKMRIVVERTWKEGLGLECPLGMDEEKYEAYRKTFDAKYKGWNEAKLKLDRQVAKQIEDDQKQYEAHGQYEKEYTAVESTNENLRATYR